MAPPPTKQQETYTCPRHPEVTSPSPGKCPQCDSELSLLDRFAAIVQRDLFFDPRVRPPKEVPVPPPPPLQWELVGLYKIGPDYMALIRDRNKRVGSGFGEFWVREKEEVPGYFGVTIASINPGPPAVVRYDRAGVGTEELKMGESGQPTAALRKDQWADIVMPVRAGYTYVVRVPELQRRIPSAEAFMATLTLEPSTEGSKVRGLRIASLPHDNFLHAAGLQQGDIVETIQGPVPPNPQGQVEPPIITDPESALELIRSLGAKEPVIQVGIIRSRTKRTISYTLLKK